ncbi:MULTISPECIES: serine/threonine-protein kinase [Streptomyces]|uniref:serine/threonine-protein kinase n=1 Tax=Streptomyces TaxID=1883 RepID=UPI0019C54D59|nr:MULTISPECIES: serine/threonine-protein kinase [Streptomyces]GGU01205.1 protein kinase [Streptomyces lateritius]
MNDGESGRRVIDGRFELEAPLGGGGMGKVWRARDLVLDRAVALKEVRPPDPGLAESDPQAAAMLRARVLREARALARVEHPNVVTIHHVVDGAEHAYPWLVMELVTGGSLQDRLAQGPLTPAAAAKIGREVLAALRAAHDVGIQHRDVKPANVLLRPDGRPVLTDFGIASIRESTALTATGSIIGTPDYMAPERISGGEGGPDADVWSLAMMLYVAVEGHHPLRRGTTLATLAAVLTEELPPPRHAGPLAGALAAVLVKDPAARPGPETFDRMLAQVAPNAEADQPASSADEATSYRLAPAPTPAAYPSAVADPPTGFGPPTPGTPAAGPVGEPFKTPVSPRGLGAPSAPHTHTPYPGGPTHPAVSPPARSSRAGRRVAIASSAVATVAAGVLTWSLLPDAEEQGAGGPPVSPAASTSASASASPGPRTPLAPGPTKTAAEANLLTPDGIRVAVKELKAAAGTDQVGRFVVYPEYVSAEMMVKGSKTRYESYSYRVGEGVSQTSMKGTLMGGDLPVGLDTYDWDILPALIARAEKDLNVKEPTTRYLVIRQPNNLFDTEAGIAVYIGDEYDSGYLDADRKGKVTRVMPADS